MTKWTETLKPIVRQNWENGSPWLRARIAYRFDGMEYLTEDELREVLETLDEENFIAQMSDDYSVTRKEMSENNAIAQKARELLG